MINNKALDLLFRIRQWDHLDGAGDGPFWKKQIDEVLEFYRTDFSIPMITKEEWDDACNGLGIQGRKYDRLY